MAMRKRPELTELAFDRKFEELRREVAAQVSPFGDISKELQEKRKARAREDQHYFNRTYLPHYFDCDPAPMHREMVELAEKRPGPGEAIIPVVFAAPRGFAKSTTLPLGNGSRRTAFELDPLILFGSETKDLAGDHVASIAAEFAENPRLIYDFGELIDYAPKNPDVTLGKTRLVGRGAGQALRGVKQRQHRPTLAFLDDLESDESAKNPDRVEKILRWICRTVYFALDPAGALVWIGTIITKRSALATAIHSAEEPYRHWIRRLYTALDEQDQSNWPAKYPTPVLHSQRKNMGTAAWEQEKQNNPLDESDFFQAGWFKTYDPAELPNDLVIVTAYDPATGGGDYAAVITLGRSVSTGLTYVLDAWLKKKSPVSAILHSLAMHKLWGLTKWRMEANGFQKLILNLLPEYELAAGISLPVDTFTSTGNKGLRIESMSPPVERGKLLFCPRQGDQRLLINQFLSYPRGNDDGPDGTEMAWRGLDQSAGQWPSGIGPGRIN